jgi:hypothetical protein
VATGDIAENHADSSLLVAGQLKRQLLLNPIVDKTGSPSPICLRQLRRFNLFGAARTASQQIKLHIKQLVEGEPLARWLKLPGVAGEKRRRHIRQAMARPQPPRKRIGCQSCRSEVLADDGEDLR